MYTENMIVIRLHKLLRATLLATLLTAVAWPSWAFAGTLTALSTTLTDDTAEATGVTYTIAATTATSDDIREIHLWFSTTQGGTTKPAGLDLSASTIGSTSNLGSGWTIDKNNAGNGQIKLLNDTAQTVAASTTIEIVLNSITNHAIDDCDTSTHILSDSCHLRIRTFSDTGSTEIDSGDTMFTVEEDPWLTFEVSGVGSGSTNNGVTTTVASTATSLPFGIIAPNSAVYAAHQLEIITNAPGGYTVTAVLAQLIEGTYDGGEIDPFAGVNATWTTPQDWETPSGTSANTNTGWFGANTSDTRVSGWESGTSGKFGPLGAIARPVAYSEGPDRTGTTVYVSYVLGINSIQPADHYSGTIRYDIKANY